MHFKVSAYNNHIVLLFLGNTCPYGSRASHILELGVTKFCHGIAKGGDCKVEFIQLLVGFISCQICL